jgi:membrane protease YdiL (CAAX protease family)
LVDALAFLGAGAKRFLGCCSSRIFCSCINGSSTPSRWASGAIRLSIRLDLLSWQNSETWGWNLSPGNESAGELLSVASSAEFRPQPVPSLSTSYPASRSARRWTGIAAALIVLLGPVLEELVCRGYLLTLLLYVAKRTALPSARAPAVIAAAVIFAAAHIWNAGITWLQLSSIASMGCLYGALRLNYRSTAQLCLRIRHTISFCA